MLLPLLCGGCVVPPVVVATSSAGDNVTYAETGKSMLDYALSEALDKDCVLMYGITRGQFCRDPSAQYTTFITDVSILFDLNPE